MALRLHNMLHTFAGRLDDSALCHARELVARFRHDEAVELVAGVLIAGKLPVRAAERDELASVLELCCSDSTLADLVTVADTAVEAASVHHFTGDQHPGQGVAYALDGVLRVLPDIRAVHAVWRTTRAGAAAGPLPQRVVLVEVGQHGSAPATAYRVDDQLRRAGIRAVVEVGGAAAGWTAYHRQALDAAVPVWHAAHAAAGTPPQQRAVPPPEPAHVPVTEPPAEPSPVAEAPSEQPERPRELAARHAAVEPRQERDSAEEDSSVPPDNLLMFNSERTQRREAVAARPTEPMVPPEPSEAVGYGDEETPAERTNELSSADVRQLRAALAGDEAATPDGWPAGIDPDAVDDPRLNERDRGLLRQLHAELAKREGPGPTDPGGNQTAG
ncbi:hypothetical protein H0B56_01220 [Haloechinothrix sp. YIM 98757]|uniref:Uncharacterized protein n=1 Tax=Haloechinothrix aidingensis TaxID=2752311 RepID=A0A838A5B0_9PSEU|nr:hypothetical protein [Haloechinothrix aidingensis]MBA0124158.1 hypothetical protein [Haloechinothrix aidingensis]